MDRLNSEEKDRKQKHMQEVHTESNVLRKFLFLHGYTFTFSLYGVIYNRKTCEAQRRRIEVFCKGELMQDDFDKILNFFNMLFPLSDFSFWCYNTQAQQIALVGEWD